MRDFQNIKELYGALRTEWEQNRPKWIDISRFVGITVDTNYVYNKSQSTKSRDLDQFVDDPTAAISVNQAGDYLLGIMWGTGENVFDIVPSRYVTELVDPALVKDFYGFATEQTLYHMNHPMAGLSTAMRPYAYDQFSFGTSGIGCFLNKGFVNRTEENALVFRNYGVDNTMVDEGKSGQCEIVSTVYNWKVNRIIGEFCKEGGVVDDKRVSEMPKPIADAYNAGDYNKEFKLVFMFFPREDYDPKLKGKRGTRYRGVWFMEDGQDGKSFYEEDFAERPVAMARAIKVRGEVYGRASGTLLISTIRSVNFMVGSAIEIIDKMSNPALGMFNNAIFGDSVLDTSPNGLTIFNQSLAATGTPMFPIHDVGDPAAIMQFLVPYLNEKIVTGFKVDALLDFSSAKEMTATESLQRYAIRGKSLSGFLLQQKNEGLVPTSKRSISLLYSIGELGVDPRRDPDRVKRLQSIGQDRRVIPDAVLQVIDEGRPWYELKFNNELEKLVRTETVQNLVQIIQAITAIAALYPQIIEAVDWYKLLKDINDNLDYNSQILISEKQFKDTIKRLAQQQAAMMQIAAAETGSKAQANSAKANKDNKEAQNVGTTNE